MNYEDLLNEEQIIPVRDTDGQVLVLAGAGSGKTRVLTYRIAYLIGELNVLPYNILAITFTNKAASEMKERVRSVTGESGVWVSTFHSMCASILRSEITALGYGKNFTIYTETESDRLITKILKSLGVDDVAKHKSNCRWHISNAKNHLKDPKDYALLVAGDDGELACRVYERYEEELLISNALDFDDLLVKTVQLFKLYPEVLEKYRNRFNYILVDEFQDTNQVQFLLVRLLAGKDGNLFVVGDDDQSIYGWRGAEVGNILNFEKYYPNSRVYKLQRNYRSSANILNCANAVIKNNASRRGKELWTDKSGGVKVEYQSCYDDRAEAEFVIKQIDNLHRQNGLKYRDFAILMRVNSLSRQFEEKLNLYSLPYKLFGGFKFYERKEVKDLLAYLRLMANHSDADALTRIINFPKRGIGDAAVQKIVDYGKNHGMTPYDVVLNIEKTDIPNATAKKIAVFKELLCDLQLALEEMPLNEFIDYLVESLDLTREFDSSDSEGYNKLLNINEFAVSIKEYASDNPSNTLADFLEQVALISDLDGVKDDDDFITLATVHAVKGLEFKCVFVVGLEEGLFPVGRSMNSTADLEEERRIMYVAVTRAKERLYITNTTQRFRFGKIESNIASRFVKEAGLGKPVDPDDMPSKKHSRYIPSISGYTSNTQANTPSKDLSEFVAGAKIVHRTFGEGDIIEVRGDIAKISFPKLGVKQFNLCIAPIVLKR